jgi:hypothetical protein
VAIAAAHGLQFRLQHINDLLRFAAAADGPYVGVGHDTTTFEALALGMHIDLVLSGLRRMVRDGKMTELSAAELHHYATEHALEEVRIARYGSGHPYVSAGVARDLGHPTRDDARAFRTAHYTPDNATLVIAGHFDAALAERWIDFLFADWTGHAVARTSPPLVPTPIALGRDRSSILGQYAMEIPATAGTRAQRLVVAAMLDEIAFDIRHQLGAGYAEGAMLDEERLGSRYMIAGSIDATRAADAVELIRSRIAKLRSDADDAARAFVRARARVLVHLESEAETASGIAGALARDTALGLAPGSATKTAADVRALRIDDLAAALGELDLDRAIVAIRGPKDKLDPAFAALHRTPTYVRVQEHDDDDDDPVAPPARTAVGDDDELTKPDDALTSDAPAPHTIALGLVAGYATGDVEHDGVGGMRVAADIGLHVDADTAVGVELAIGYMSGTFDTGEFLPMLHPISDVPIDASLFARVGYRRLWGSALAGLHLDRVNADGEHTTGAGFGIGLQGGIDVWTMPRARFGVFGRVDSVLASSVSFAMFSVGIAYHR